MSRLKISGFLAAPSEPLSHNFPDRFEINLFISRKNSWPSKSGWLNLYFSQFHVEISRILLREMGVISRRFLECFLENRSKFHSRSKLMIACNLCHLEEIRLAIREKSCNHRIKRKTSISSDPLKGRHLSRFATFLLQTSLSYLRKFICQREQKTSGCVSKRPPVQPETNQPEPLLNIFEGTMID
jgi:hypothetical protein